MVNDREAYIVEKLGEAVDALVADAGPVRERLFNASTYLLRISPEQIADEQLRCDLPMDQGQPDFCPRRQ